LRHPYGFAFDEHARVGELNILGFRLAADAAFQPIATALTGEAGPAALVTVVIVAAVVVVPARGDCQRWRRPGVLDVVPRTTERESRVGSLNVKSARSRPESKLGSELRVGNRLNARGGRRGDRETGTGSVSTSVTCFGHVVVVMEF